jgi:hypothetical protein
LKTPGSGVLRTECPFGTEENDQTPSSARRAVGVFARLPGHSWPGSKSG